jgi:hypothetical protein
MPEGARLVRTYLGLSRVPQLSDVQSLTVSDQRAPAADRPHLAAQSPAVGAGRVPLQGHSTEVP